MQSDRPVEQRIVDTARRLFVERGYLDTNMSDIAAATGIKRPALHYYFRTKERLFEAVYADIVRQIIPRIQDILRRDTSLEERLNAILDEYIVLFTDNPALPQFIVGEIQRDPRHLIEVGETLQVGGYLRTLHRTLAGEIGSGRLKRVPLRTVLLTLYSQLFFPFLTRNLITTLWLDEPETFADFLQMWKGNILSQMRCLLGYGDPSAVRTTDM